MPQHRRMEKRELLFSIDGSEGDGNSFPVTISTTHPVRRTDAFGYEFDEVLSLDPDAIDLTRAPLPVVEQHDHGTLNIGIVENIMVSGDRLRGLLRLGVQERAREILADIKAGIVRNLSVGYQILDSVMEGDVQRITRWCPHEVSLVSVPADPHAGIGRSKKMDEIATPARVNTFTSEQWQDRELDRQEAIRSTFRLAGMRDDPAIDRLKQRCIEDPRMTPAQARDELLELVGAGQRAAAFEASVGNPQPLSMEAYQGRAKFVPGDGSGRAQLLPKEMPLEGYSIIDAILVQADPNFRGGGFEREVSQEICMRGQIKPRAGGLMMPIDLPGKASSMSRRELVYGGGAGSGASLVGVEHRPDLFVDLMRARSVVLESGATRINNLVQNQSIPRMTDTAGVNWIELDGTSQITPADATFDDITLEPHQLAGISSYSWRMLRQGLPDTEQVIRNDLARAHAAALDETALQGSGVGPIPAGLSILAAATPTYTAGSLAYSDIVGLEDAVYSNNGDTTGSLAFVVASDLVGTLKSTEKIASGGQPIAEGAGGDGMLTMSGYPVRHTNGAPSASVYFGSWSQCWIAQWGAVEIQSNPYSEFDKGSVSVRLIGDWDIAVRHPESFGYLTTV